MTIVNTGPFSLAMVAGIFIAASQSALAIDPTPNWCEGVRIAAFPGGYEPGRGDFYSDAVYNGYRQAALDLGPTVTYYFSHWSPKQMIRGVKQALDQKVDGIALLAYGFDAEAQSLIDEAFAQGTIMISAAVQLPDDEKKYASLGMGYVGSPPYEGGASVASKLIERAELKADDSALIWGEKAAGEETSRYVSGVTDTLEKAGVQVIYLEVDPSAYNGDVGPSLKALSKAMGANSAIKAVFIEHGFLTANVALFAGDLRRGQVYVVGSELSRSALKALKDGYLNLIVDEQPYLNGYLPILNICLTKKFGFSGLHFNRGIVFVDSGNIDGVAPLVDKVIR